MPLPTAPPPNTPAVAADVEPPPVVFFEAGIGGRVVATDQELRVSVGVGIQPPRFPLGAALEAHLGTGGAFKEGRWFRGGFALPLRYSILFGRTMAVEIGAGPLLSILSVDGTVSNAPIHVVKVDPGLRATLAFEFRGPSFAIAAVASTDIQEHAIYSAGGMQVLEVSPAGLSFILRVRAGIL